MNQPKYRQVINYDLTIPIVSLFSLSNLQITTELRSATVDKVAGILQNTSGNPN